MPDGPTRQQSMQECNGLKELEGEGALSQRLQKWGFHDSGSLSFDQTRSLRPARGCHSCNTSFLCRVLTESCVKLFRDALIARNRSRTLANRNGPPPVNLSSSSSISMRIPRANVIPSSEETRANCRRLRTPTMLSITFSE